MKNKAWEIIFKDIKNDWKCLLGYHDWDDWSCQIPFPVDEIIKMKETERYSCRMCCNCGTEMSKSRDYYNRNELEKRAKKYVSDM